MDVPAGSLFIGQRFATDRIMSERGHLSGTRSVYKITYRMDTGAAMHYARNAQAAISFFDQTMIAGGTVSLVQDHKGNSIKMVELRQHAKAQANADSTETTVKGAAPPTLERPLQRLFEGWKKPASSAPFR